MDLDFLHRSTDASHFHVVAYPERLEQDDHHTGSKVTQRVLESQTDCQAGRTQNSHQRGSFYAELIQGGNDNEGKQDNVGNIADKFGHSGVDALVEHVVDPVGQLGDDPFTHNEDDQRCNDIPCVGHQIFVGKRLKLIQILIH